MKALAVVFSVLASTAAFAQGFELKIPLGPSWSSYYDGSPQCRFLIGSDPLSIFGIEAHYLSPNDAGLTVTKVVPNGPSARFLAPGDLLVSMNGKPFVSPGSGPAPSLWEGYNFSRGVYLFGYRNNEIIEHVILPCGKRETVFPFGRADLFGPLYASVGRGVGLSESIIVTGFARGKEAGRAPSAHYTTNRYILQDHYCQLKKFTKVDVITTRSNVSSTGSRYNERKTTYSYTVDLALAESVRSNFNETHNQKTFLVREVELAVSRLKSQIGCANPEWKGFEKKIYELAGRDWDRFGNQVPDWGAMELAPPNR